MFKILIHKRAAKIYEELDDKTAAKINNAIDALKENPFYGRNIKRLRGQLEGKYRLRVGDYRIIYRIEEEEKVDIIEDIKRRGYKKEGEGILINKEWNGENEKRRSKEI